MFNKIDIKLFGALAAVALIWGTTYLGIRVAVESVPSWYVTSIRQGIASLIVLIILLYQKQFKWIGWKAFKFQLMSSLLMIVIANGFTTIAEQSLPSALTAILSSLSPLVVYAFGLMANLQQSTWKGWLGVLVGLSGVVYLFRDGLSEFFNQDYLVGIIYLSIAIVSWSWGTIYTKLNTHFQENITLNLFYLFGIGAVIQYVLALLFNPNPNFEEWTFRSVSAIIYLAVFGSIIAFFSYHYALKRVSALQVSILNYINTVIAIFLGWLLLDEVINVDFIVATLLILSGVFITNYKKSNDNKNVLIVEDGEIS